MVNVNSVAQKFLAFGSIFLILCCAREKLYKFENITVDKTKKEIQFNAELKKKQGWVQFLIYVQGYKWLKNDCAFVSDVKLLQLQTAIAYLDWQLWDKIYTQGVKKGVKIFILSGGQKIEARKLIKTDEEIEPVHLIFLGSPYFDPVVLKNSPNILCNTCPLYNLEKRALEKEFKRFQLNPVIMKKIKDKVKIIIKIYD